MAVALVGALVIANAARSDAFRAFVERQAVHVAGAVLVPEPEGSRAVEPGAEATVVSAATTPTAARSATVRHRRVHRATPATPAAAPAQAHGHAHGHTKARSHGRATGHTEAKGHARGNGKATGHDKTHGSGHGKATGHQKHQRHAHPVH